MVIARNAFPEQALYKEYERQAFKSFLASNWSNMMPEIDPAPDLCNLARCWDSVDESLTADRLDRIHQVLHGKKAWDFAQPIISPVHQ